MLYFRKVLNMMTADLSMNLEDKKYSKVYEKEGIANSEMIAVFARMKVTGLNIQTMLMLLTNYLFFVVVVVIADLNVLTQI